MNQITFLLRIVRRSWWVVVVCALTASNLALVLAYQQDPQYRAEASYLVRPGVSIEDNRDLLNSFFPLDGRALTVTYAEILQSERMFATAAEELDIETGTLKLYKKSAVVLPESNVLVLSVSGPDPEVAASLVNTIGQLSIDYFSQLYQVYDVQLLDPAVTPTVPYSPTPVRDAGIAGALGVAIGFGLGFARESLSLLGNRNT